ncbi:uncharacterized protein LOC119955119 isoform X2 [Scyliorhinus canicula]|uniref:uncharacterized protein LOC119955119 isoform X2 n=1 Tax=Scyliorhinus canicula TaxID=7830 RepID=UPI0018F36503|nr:uncharacterized protein LOC119955119 isoform X2 [Scyliorhinus canicula]XP_038636937.1 uncharacterized protein LOC119955119 isoform X2 [Scyliorhinus canicula]XP_038636938.1 uncharacterized protein LOC119955119 isoform X2 [Scyliorhinus canicula]
MTNMIENPPGIPTSETDEVGTSSTLDDVAKPNVPPGSGSSGKESESDIQSRSDLCDRNLEGASRVPGPVLEEDAELSYSETEAGSTSVPDDEVPEDQNMEPETVAPLPSPDPTEKQEDAAIEPGSEIAADQKATERNRDGNAEPTVRLKDKETLFMLLALHMEESPLCENPMGPKPARNEKNIMINKTGIVICDSDSIQRVVMMDCSREQLHAAQLVMMNLTTRAKSCDVYLSRKPCTDCAKCLVQGGVRSVIFWPKDPEYSLENKDTGEKVSNEVNQIFRISSTIATPHVPIIDCKGVVSQVCRRTRRQKCKECQISDHIDSLKKELIRYWKKSEIDYEMDNKCLESLIDCTLHCYDVLLNCNHGRIRKIPDFTPALVAHSLQLCFLLAARSDDPDRGVGAIIYNKRHSIIGVGYNGYIKKTTYGNFPRSGRNSNRTVSKSSSMVHAEVNALLFRSGKGTDSSVMFASKIPCSECEKMINASGIKIVVSVNDWKGTMEPRAGALELMEGAQESGEEVGSQEPGEGVKIILWEWPSELRGNQDNTDPPTMTHSCKLAVSVGPVRLPNKDDLLMYLALQMEDSPLCVEPKEKGKIKFSKTGITIFAGGGTNQILVIDCSRNGLHAVQQVLLSFPKCLQGNVVYLSRHPCVHCAKLLLQGVVGQVYYWPNLEQQEADDNEDALDNANKVNRLFRGAKVSAEMYIPLLDLETVVKRISPKIRLIPSTKPKVRTSIFDSTNLTKILEALQLLHIKKKDYKATFRKQMETAYKCLDALQNSTVGNFKKKSAGNPESQDGRNLHELSNSTDGNLEINNSSRDAEKEKRDLHALQLCFLLAARTDSPGPGVGALIYQDDCFVGIGYNGFPRGNRCGQYLQNYPELKEDGAQSQKKASGAQQQSRNFIICAEANALYFR